MNLVEVTALDRFVQDSVNNNPAENTAIRFPECPRCKQKIRRCTRYMPIINHVHNLITKVKAKILGNHSAQDLNDRRKLLLQEYERMQTNIQEIFLNHKMKTFFMALYDSEKLFSNDMLILMKNILLFLNEIDKLLVDGKKKLSGNIFEDFVSIPLRHIIEYLFGHSQYQNFAEQQINDIQAELERIRRLIYIEALSFSLKQSLNSKEQEGIDSMRYLTKKTGAFTLKDQQQFDILVKKFEHLNNLPGLGITERERVAIVSALNMTQGHWYVCPNDHPYVITEV